MNTKRTANQTAIHFMRAGMAGMLMVTSGWAMDVEPARIATCEWRVFRHWKCGRASAVDCRAHRGHAGA